MRSLTVAMIVALAAAAPLSVSAESGSDRAQIAAIYQSAETQLRADDFTHDPLRAARAPGFVALNPNGEVDQALSKEMTADELNRLKAQMQSSKYHTVKAQITISRLMVVGDRAIAVVGMRSRASVLIGKAQKYTEYIDSTASELDDWQRSASGWQISKSQTITSMQELDAQQYAATLNQIYQSGRGGGGGRIDPNAQIQAMQQSGAQMHDWMMNSALNQTLHSYFIPH